jgi:thiol-disulfide isomerase/thioredoxin
MKAAALAMAVFLLFGCAQQGRGGNENGTGTGSAGSQANVEEIPAENITANFTAENSTVGPANTIQANGTQAQNNQTQKGSTNGANATIPLPTKNTTGVMMADYKPPEIPHYDFSDRTTTDGRLIVHYFYMSGCSACKALGPEIDRMMADYPNVAWMDYDLTTSNGSAAYRDFAAQYNLSAQQQMVPQVLVDKRIMTGRFDINATLEGIITNHTQANHTQATNCTQATNHTQATNCTQGAQP